MMEYSPDIPLHATLHIFNEKAQAINVYIFNPQSILKGGGGEGRYSSGAKTIEEIKIVNGKKEKGVLI